MGVINRKQTQTSADFLKQAINIVDINDITYKINGAIFEVNKILGPGFLEKIYENALLFELKNRGLEADQQVPIKVNYKNNLVGEYFADICLRPSACVRG